ncbi:MAG: hypothetical protein B7Z15_09800, partial [Rhizobiales bacterium 32-66-8]
MKNYPDTSGRPLPMRALAVVAFAGIGLLAGVSGDWSGSEGFGVARAPSTLGAEAKASSQTQAGALDVTVADEDLTAQLASQLADLARTALITPAQQPAWQSFTAAMLDLARRTRIHEQRLAAGAPIDDAGERALHTLLFGAAMNELEANLTSQQTLAIRRATDP